jgi:hypothetical protein
MTLTTLTGFPLKTTSLPTDLSEAAGNNCDTGKFLSSNTFIIVLPTNPVAPITAVFILIFLEYIKLLFKFTVTLKLSKLAFFSIRPLHEKSYFAGFINAITGIWPDRRKL